ncbi:MAG: iron-sulfur cluster-binding domain-containing protein [Rhodocyclaceae bacterium]|nr:iron-sulfur cluster-binding domain-containing protein [Rhodocyclaceae bacterium]
MLALFDIGIADLVAYAGLTALGLLAANQCIGILISLRYDTANRFPKRRLPLIGIHEWTGYLCLLLILLHPALLLLSAKPLFVLSDLLLPFRQTVQPLENSLGALAAYLVLVVVVTSYFRARFSFRAWKTIHYANYVLSPALIWHAVFTEPTLTGGAIDYLDGGKVFAEFASALIIVAAGWRGWLALQRRRAPLPTGFTILQDDGEIAPVWRGALTVAAIRDETHNVKTFVLCALERDTMPFRWLPGQYLTLHLPGAEGQHLIRNYTIASPPTRGGCCEITVKRGNGPGSQFMHDQLQVGASLDVSGPHGGFVFTGEEAQRIVLIGGGVGVTPLMCVLRYLSDISWHGQIHFLYSVMTPQDLIYAHELELLAESHPQLHLTLLVTEAGHHPWRGNRGLLSSDLLSPIPHLTESRVHLCGPEPMMRAVRKMLTTMHVPAEHVHTESFGPASLEQIEEKAWPAEVGSVTLTFLRSNHTVRLADGECLLSAAERCGVAIESSCREGHCGSCRVRLVSGKVRLGAQSVLSDEDIARGEVLACVCRSAQSPIVVDR